MTDVANLVIKADSTDIKTADKSLKNLNKTADKTEKSTKKMDKGFASTSSTLKKLLPLIKASAAAYVAFQMVRVARETEMYIARLKTMTGSLESANNEFERLNLFARETPFTLQQSIDAFIQLKALGLDPSERAMASYGNTAAAMGKSLTQMIEAVADASTNEFERLKEFGIKAKQQGDQVTFTFQGVSTTVKKSSEEIQEYLMNIGETNFAGAMADQVNTIDGQMSNLTQSFDDFWRTLGDGLGVADMVKSSLSGISGAVTFLTKELEGLFTNIKNNRIAELLKEIAEVDLEKASNQRWLDKNAWTAYAGAVELTAGNFERLSEKSDMLHAELDALMKTTSDTAQEVEKVDEETEKLGSTLTLVTPKVSEFETALNKIRDLHIQDVLFDINEAIDEGKVVWSEYYQLLRDYGQLAEEEIPKIAETMTETNAEMEKGMVDWAGVAEYSINGVSGAFIDMAIDGKSSFNDFAQSFLANIAKMIAQQAILSGMKGAFPSLFAANGAAFNSGNVIPMAKGGLITQPTLFPMANGGTALAGEVDTEVIMPIGRTSSGDMGVKAEISGGGTVVNINNYTQSKATTQTTQNADGSKTIDVLIKEQVNAAIAGGGLDRTNAKVYNNRRVGY